MRARLVQPAAPDAGTIAAKRCRRAEAARGADAAAGIVTLHCMKSSGTDGGMPPGTLPEPRARR